MDSTNNHGESDLEVTDVLQEHRNRNRANRAPNPENMPVFASRQSANKPASVHLRNGCHVNTNIGSSVTRGNSPGNAEAGDIEEEEEETFPSSQSFNPRALRNYPPDWRSVMTEGKQVWHCILLNDLENPFPDKESCYKIIVKLLKRLVSERHAKGEDISCKPLFVLFICLSLLKCMHLIARAITRDMVTIVSAWHAV